MRSIRPICISVVIVMTVTATVLAGPSPFYSYVRAYAEGGNADSASPMGWQVVEGQGQGLSSAQAGSPWWIPGPGGAIVFPPVSASGWSELNGDPWTGDIHAKTGAFHTGAQAGWEIGWLGGLWYEPQIWGMAHAYGYLRSTWQIVPDGDAGLQEGQAVEVAANLSLEGEMDGGPSGDVRAAVLLSRSGQTPWLQAAEYTTFGTLEDMGVAPLLQYSAQDQTEADIAYSSLAPGMYQVGDTLVFETLFETSVSLDNDGLGREMWSDFMNTTESGLIVGDGARLVPVGGYPVTIPSPAAILLGLQGVLLLTAVAPRRRRPSPC
jgi:hypothetical protein